MTLTEFDSSGLHRAFSLGRTRESNARTATGLGLRAFIALLVLLALGLAGEAAGQAGARTPRVAVVLWRVPLAELTGDKPSHWGARVLRRSLEDLGWKDGRNIQILWRSAEGRQEVADRILDELVAARVDAIAVSGNLLVRSAMRRTKTIPILMMWSSTPVEGGLVASLARPGGNVTGMLGQPDVVDGKQLEIFTQAVPGLRRIAVLNEGSGTTPAAKAAARELGVSLLHYRATTMPELHSAIEDAVKRGAKGAWVSTSLAAVKKQQAVFFALAERYKLPMLYSFSDVVAAGGLMYYGPRRESLYERTAAHIDRILRGAKPAEMPVETPSNYRLVVNLRAAKAIGLSIPPAILALADEVVE